jgi:hypothetical protein
MPRPDDDERRDDLTATSESLQADAERLLSIEQEKQGLDAEDPRVDTLSREAEQVAEDVEAKSRVERQIAAENDPERGAEDYPN